jgi:quinol-cytochrome oxidoreductase complex cytochrome b subunit/mono/diheme cytochrome c family protein
MRIRFRSIFILSAIFMICWGVLLSVGTANVSSAPAAPLSTPLFYDRPDPPPTVYPPAQSDNGAQAYSGICQDCHGDRGQGLTADWRAAFAPEYQDCWASGCHGEDAPRNSFVILESGAPALAGPGALPQFSNAFELGTYIQGSMPLSRSGSLSNDQTWELAAFLLSLNERSLKDLELSGNSAAAIPLHREVKLPKSEFPGVVLLSLTLILSAVGISLRKRLGTEKTAGKQKGNFYHHLHPPKIPAAQARFGYTLGAGGLAVFFSIILLITGLLEMYYYQPSPEGAAISIQTITSLVPFGNLIRNTHYWSAQLLVITMTIHLLRVVLTGANAPPRRFNYLLGLILLVLILLLDFTGYVLRWDEGIRWALVVGTNLLKTIPVLGEGLYHFVIGGSAPGAAALIRFYTWHVFGLTLAVAGVTVWHIFRVRRDGGISSPPPIKGEKIQRISRFELGQQELLAMLIAGVILLLLSALIPAPIDQPIIENGRLTGDSRAPWFFLWIQELLQLGSPFLWGIAVPILIVVVLGLLPYLLPNAKEKEWGRWFPQGNRIAQLVGALIIGVIFFLTILGFIK